MTKNPKKQKRTINKKVPKKKSKKYHNAEKYQKFKRVPKIQ